MVVIWSKEENLCLIEIMNSVNQRFEQDWKPQTVSTFLHRLILKGYLSMYRKGRITYYAPLVAREEYAKKCMKEYIDRICDGDKKMAIELLENGL